MELDEKDEEWRVSPVPRGDRRAGSVPVVEDEGDERDVEEVAASESDAERCGGSRMSAEPVPAADKAESELSERGVERREIDEVDAADTEGDREEICVEDAVAGVGDALDLLSEFI